MYDSEVNKEHTYTCNTRINTNVGILHPHMCTHIHTHTQCKSKAYNSHYISLSEPSTGMPETIQTLEPCVANPGLVTRRRAVQASQIEIAECKVL